ncbi:MAG: DUF1853 family protein [Burkholderiaceae bacterium]
MPTTRDKAGWDFQRFFHARWDCLNDPHVRSLAWLLDSPSLLAPGAPQWQGKVGSLNIELEPLKQWLIRLDSAPDELHTWLNVHPVQRLGRYAEKLMAFYFMRQGSLISHGLQLRGPNQETLGEFDFLLSVEGRVLHLEMATKFYLLETEDALPDRSHVVDYFIGPNLADTLGLKMRKIIDKQLSLGRHPAARSQLPYRINMSEAFIKGWLFYHGPYLPDIDDSGLSEDHCRGFWCTVSELEQRAEQHYLVLPRLSWLSPAKSHIDRLLDKQSLLAMLTEKFQRETMPVLVAIMESQRDSAIETRRGFIVPDDWQVKAGQRRAQGAA